MALDRGSDQAEAGVHPGIDEVVPAGVGAAEHHVAAADELGDSQQVAVAGHHVELELQSGDTR